MHTERMCGGTEGRPLQREGAAEGAVGGAPPRPGRHAHRAPQHVGAAPLPGVLEDPVPHRPAALVGAEAAGHHAVALAAAQVSPLERPPVPLCRCTCRAAEQAAGLPQAAMALALWDAGLGMASTAAELQWILLSTMLLPSAGLLQAGISPALGVMFATDSGPSSIISLSLSVWLSPRQQLPDAAAGWARGHLPSPVSGMTQSAVDSVAGTGCPRGSGVPQAAAVPGRML